MTAAQWLTAHGYSQWSDMSWRKQGYGAELESVLNEYMEEESVRITTITRRYERARDDASRLRYPDTTGQ